MEDEDSIEKGIPGVYILQVTIGTVPARFGRLLRGKGTNTEDRWEEEGQKTAVNDCFKEGK